MSEIALFKTGAQLPDYLRNEPDEMTKRLAGTSAGKTISIKGGVWRMKVGSEEVARNEDRAMNIVIVNAAEHVARTYYEGTYEEGKDTPPSCYSADGKTPDASVKSPQSRTCLGCPQNIAGSGQGESRACRFSQRFAVVLDGDLGGNVYRLQLPAKSLFGKADGDKMPLQAYAKFLAGHGVPMGGIVTEARFDTAEAVPVLKFRAVRPLTREEYEVARAQSTSEDALQAIEFKMVLKEDKQAAQAALPSAFKAESTAHLKTSAAQPVNDDVQDTEDAPAPVPVKRPAKKVEPVAVVNKDINSVMDEWGSDDE